MHIFQDCLQAIYRINNKGEIKCQLENISELKKTLPNQVKKLYLKAFRCRYRRQKMKYAFKQY